MNITILNDQPNMSFETYRKIFENIANTDCEERRFQNELLLVFLRASLTNIEIMETGEPRIPSQNHDLSQYCGEVDYEDGKKKFWRPDLTACDKWYRHNIVHKVKYKFVVEAKSPYSREKIFDNGLSADEILKTESRVKREIESHFNAKCNDKVILTDTIRWVFYKKENNKIVSCADYVLKEKTSNGWKWVQLISKQLPDSEFFKEIGIDNYVVADPQVFVDLIEKLNEFAE